LWSSIVAKEGRAIKAKPGLRAQKSWPCRALSPARIKAVAALRRAMDLNIHRRDAWAEFLDQIESQKSGYQQRQQHADDCSQSASAYKQIAFAQPAAPAAFMATENSIGCD
jgi:hypothetical protein